MDITKLKAFMVVAEQLNFRKSAEILGMSQPPLTRLIAAFESELGTPLFERTTRQVKLTGAGVFLLQESRRIMQNMEEVEKQVRSIGKMKRGDLKIGFSITAFLARLPRIIEEFHDRFPGIHVDLEQGSDREILKGLRTGHFDVGFIGGTMVADSLETMQVKDQPLGVLLPRRHRLAKRKEIDLTELKDDTIILHPRQESEVCYDTFAHLFAAADFHPNIYIKGERESCLILVATGKGVSLTVSGSQGFASEDTSFVPVKNLFMPVSAYWDAENRSASTKSFLSFVSENRSLKPQTIECLTDVLRV